MKRHGNLFEEFISWDNIMLAYTNAKKGKTWQGQVKKVTELDLRYLQKVLEQGHYRVSKYRTIKIYEPKERDIYILPFYPDRIVHHALINILEPIYDKIFIEESYSCRKGKGQHKASKKCMEYVKRNKYVLQCDISKFYPSINHEILLKIIKRKIKDKGLLQVIEAIINSFPGEKNVPIGNFTSQWFGNIYLNEIDMLIKHELKIKNYIRYCDDYLLFSDDKEYLWYCLVRIKEKLNELKLSLSKFKLYKTSQGVTFVGYRHFKDKVFVRKDTARRMKEKVHKLKYKLQNGTIKLDSARSSVDSILGWLHHANTQKLIDKLELDKVRCFIMKGIPNNLNSKADYIWSRENMEEEYWRPLFQGLLDTLEDWFMIYEKDYIDDEKHKIIVDERTENKTYWELRLNPNAKLFRLGFTVEEVEGYLK